MASEGFLWDYCDCCGKRIEVGDPCYDVTDGRTLCIECVDFNKCAGEEEDGN